MKIIVKNKYCEIITQNKDVLKKIKKLLSYKQPGAEYTPAYKNGWDGMISLISNRNEFGTGLLNKVVTYLNNENIDFVIEDNRNLFDLNNEIDITKKCAELNLIPRDYQIRALNAAIDNNMGIIRGATGSGKCSDINSLHLTEHGLLDYAEIMNIFNIPKIKRHEYHDLEINLSTPLKKDGKDKTSHIYYDGYGISREILTKYGFKLTATPNHKIQIIDKNGDVAWKKFSELEIGDYTIINYDNNIFGNNIISNDEAYWYGLLIGDGGLTAKNTVTLTNMDDHIIEFSKNYLDNINIKYNVKKTKSKAVDIKIHSKIYRKKLFDLGFDYLKSTHKILPLSIRKLAKEPLSMVIRGIYETDGWVDDKKPCICLGLSNKKLTDQLHLLLLNFGIVASRRIKKTNREDCHILTIYREFIPKFMKEIGFDKNGKKYKNALKIMKTINNTVSNSNNNLIPNQHFNIKKLINNFDNLYGRKILKQECCINFNTVKSWSGEKYWRIPSKENLLKFITWYSNKLKADNNLSEDIQIIICRIIELCSKNFYYLPIKNIKETMSDNYDFCIPDTHSFVSQGFTNHNTFLAAMMAAKFNKPTIIYVIGLDLLQQFYDLFSQIFDEKIGWIGNGICDIQKITIASVWSLGAALELKNNILIDDDNVEEEVSPSRRDKAKILNYLSEAKIHIIDECHACTCETLQSIHKYINPERIYGLSGTPYRDDGSDLLINSMLGEIIENISASELIAKGVLAQPIIKFINVPFQPHNSSVYKQVYKEYIVDNEIRNQIIVDQTKKLIDKGYKPLVLFQTINHGKYLFEEFKKANMRCDLLHGNDSLDKRNEIKKKLDDDEIDCIIASTIFDIGLNLPKLSGLVLAGGGKSKVRILQRIGRVIRMIDGKSKAAIVDFMDNARYLDKHSKIRYETYLSEPGFKILGS